MTYKRILTIQDISCVGQCSLTVALPIISACGIETCILPSAVLSTHTGGFTGFTVRDLSDDIPGIAAHWQKEGIKFDAIYTGYLGSEDQIDYVLDISEKLTNPGAVKIFDPAMADNGSLYPAFDDKYVVAMRRLCSHADFVLPNITEASLLTGMEYRTEYDEGYVR
ncbi:MAG: bifunctional hydroxymethylpyrimidine kinase/phosphomethylpyrimidine kinase, partial [Coriobacteriales bacterium]